jgi:hypothetical protein
MLAWAAQAVCYGFAGSLLLMLLRVCWTTVRFFGGLPVGAVSQMLRFTFHSQSLYRETLPALLGPAIAAGIWLPFGARLPRPMIAFLVATFAQSVFLLVRSLQPPVALFLGGSSPAAADLLVRINTVLWPLRCVALLDPVRMHFLQRNAVGDNLRTRDPRLWKSIVHGLIETTPIVVVDTRKASGPLAQEAFIVLAPAHAAKVAFITGEDRRAPALDVHRIDPRRHALTCVTEEELIPLLWDWTQTRHSLPQPLDGRTLRPRALEPENFENLPTVLAVILVDGFDSEGVVHEALASGRQLLHLSTPLSRFEQQDAQWLLELSWEFVHNPDLAVMIFDESARALIRISYLREVGNSLQQRRVQGLVPPFSFSQLDQPEPIWAAVRGFLMELAEQAKASGREVRYVRH